jgi:WD40 repeat protein
MKLRILAIALLSLFTSVVAVSQPRVIFHPTGEMKIDADDRIVGEKLLPGGNKLLLIRRKSVQVWDLRSATPIASQPIDVPDMTEDYGRVISPDGRFMVVFGNYKSGAKQDKIKRPASVWNLETGKQIAAFDQKPVRYARWSRNGRTLIIANDEIETTRLKPVETELSFWDGETFQHLNTVHVQNLKWSYLTADGSKFLYSVGMVKDFFLIKYLKFSSGPINVWDIRSGKVEQTIAANLRDPEQGLRSISVSPDERFLTFVTQPEKSKESERTLVVWSIDKRGSTYEMTRRYEIKPTPKISDWGASFSPDGKYLALITAKGHYGPHGHGIFVQLYASEGGTKVAESSERNLPSHWFDRNQILLFSYSGKMKAVELASGKKLYEDKIIYESYQETRSSETPSMIFPGLSDYETFYGAEVVLDETRIVPHPSDEMFLSYSKEYVKVYDTKTGAVMQTLIEPPIDTSKPADPKKKPRLKRGLLVSKVDWANDGNMLYIVSADKQSVSFWSIN